MTTDEAVAAGMAIFATLEAKAKECKTAIGGFSDVFDTIHANGVISEFEAKALMKEANAIGVAVDAAVWTFHAKTTQRAQLKGIDVPQPLDGGGSR